MTIQEILAELGKTSKAAIKESIEEYIYQECRAAKEYQRQKDIIAAVAAFYDSGTDKNTIYELLAKYYQIDSREEAEGYIREGRCKHSYKRLLTYLSDNGYSHTETRAFMEANHVMDKLKNNPKLCELSSGKLIKEIEKE